MFIQTSDGGDVGSTPLTVDAKGLAGLIDVSESNVNKRAAKRAWLRDELPVPITVAGTRRWYVPAVHEWLRRLQSEADERWLGPEVAR